MHDREILWSNLIHCLSICGFYLMYEICSVEAASPHIQYTYKHMHWLAIENSNNGNKTKSQTIYLFVKFLIFQTNSR